MTPDPSHPFSRYAEFTDLDALIASSTKPLRKCMRVNTLKCTVEEFKAWAKAKDWVIEPVPWCREGFFVDRENRDEALGKDLLHILGYVYMQEASSMLPVALLDPQPGETVLDMSAAPGSKTTQIAARMNGTGRIVANDVQEKRIWSLLANMQRCGLTNTVVTRKAGQWFGGRMTEMFDRVLCDAPCTAQGTSRKDPDALTYCSEENTRRMSQLQRELLESAIHAAKVGGRIVYSTCTLTPEENEGVILSMLNKFEGKLEVLSPTECLGLTGKNSAKFFQSVGDSEKVQESIGRNCYPLPAHRYPLLRLWPHTFDTEGFFSAVLQKTAPTRDRNRESIEPHHFPVVSQSKVHEMTKSLAEWFGVPFLREEEMLLEGKDEVVALNRAFLDFYLPTKPYYSGLPFGKYTPYGMLRLSHDMATLRGAEAKSQVLTLSAEDMRRVLQGVNIDTSLHTLEDGDVFLALGENVLSRPMICGRGKLKAGSVLNRLPREIVKMFT